MGGLVAFAVVILMGAALIRAAWPRQVGDVHHSSEPALIAFDPPLTSAESEAYWVAISDDTEPSEPDHTNGSQA